MRKSPEHSWTTESVREALGTRLPPGWTSHKEDPVRIPAYDEPEPDIAIIRGSNADYKHRLPEPADVVLLVEVSDATLAMDRALERARAALSGVPGETRDPLPDGRTRYSRPLPGRDRMYPETDIPPIPITADRIARLRTRLPERPEELEARLTRSHGLPEEVVRQLVYGDHVARFEALAARGHAPGLVARLLTQDLPSVVGAEGAPPFEPSVERLDAVLSAAESGRIAKEGIPALLATIAQGVPDVDAAIAKAGLSGFSREDLVALVRGVVEANAEMVRTRGEAAFSPLMGDVMRAVRGRRDGKEVSDTLRAEIARLRAATGT
jgi:glutamyl-tRNA(Gln) amidotransferase subunit E